MEKELVDMFMGTLKGPYYDKMVGSVSSGFSNLVVIGERIENGIKNGKIQGASSGSYHAKRPTPTFAKKKEGETNAVVHQESRPPMSFPPQQNKFQGPQRKFDPLPTSKSEILRYLISESLVEIKSLAPPPLGKATPKYNANERCEYHANSPGHTLEKRWAFRHKVQDLIESGAIAFEKPNVKTNPMPHHDGAVNAIELKEHSEEEYVAMVDRNEPLMIPSQGARKPLIIPYSKPPLRIPTQEHTRVIPIRAPYPLDKMKAVPWEYNSGTNTVVSSIVGPGGITRSGRVFKTAQAQPKPNEDLTQASDQAATRPSVEAIPKDKEATNKNAEEFLALIKKSDYRVVDQLQQTPSKISLLSLLVPSEKHRDALMKILNAAHVTKEITVNQFDGMVANLTAGACMGFSNHELPPQGKAHNKALHIYIQCGKARLSRVLIDTDLSLNVMPKATLDKIALEGLVVRPSRLVKIKFVDGNSIVTVNGEEDIFVSNLDSYKYIEVGEGALETAFQALEIATAVTLLVEKMSRAVTSWRDLQDLNMKGWGRAPEILEKKDRLGLGYQPSKITSAVKEEQRFPPITQTFVTGGYEHVAMISNMDPKEGTSNFIRRSEEGDEEDDGLLEESSRLMDKESKSMLPPQEAIDIINLGTDKEPREIKIGATLN
ncbi:uncharacterized protein LOC131659544 [Vicia villosa]|uniref:uncharacterized protein LOC131659544 n=1 Tax=Vicia villosa TaxID=3911 RepID=UPI00273BD080|nr:uncharacterized protein LOC131659544 [Vicia villosa]